MMKFFCQIGANPGASDGKRSAEQLLTRVMRNDFLIRALRSKPTPLVSIIMVDLYSIIIIHIHSFVSYGMLLQNPNLTFWHNS